MDCIKLEQVESDFLPIFYIRPMGLKARAPESETVTLLPQRETLVKEPHPPKGANIMNTKKPLANKNKVYESYDRIGDWFDQNRSRDLSFEEHHLKEVAKHLHAGAKVLDVGCGTGRPIAEYFLSRGFQVTGTDASQKMIDLAKVYIPAARLVLQDMRALSLDEKFDAIILWHSSFHLPAEDQRLLFKRIQDHAHPNALLLFTSGPEHGEAWGENGGEVLYHASLSQEEYKSLLQTHGFKLISLNINDALSGGATVWLAIYKN